MHAPHLLLSSNCCCEKLDSIARSSSLSCINLEGTTQGQTAVYSCKEKERCKFYILNKISTYIASCINMALHTLYFLTNQIAVYVGIQTNGLEFPALAKHSLR